MVRGRPSNQHTIQESFQNYKLFIICSSNSFNLRFIPRSLAFRPSFSDPHTQQTIIRAYPSFHSRPMMTPNAVSHISCLLGSSFPTRSVNIFPLFLACTLCISDPSVAVTGSIEFKRDIRIDLKVIEEPKLENKLCQNLA